MRRGCIMKALSKKSELSRTTNSAEPEPVETTVNYNSDTEFFQLANGMEYEKVWKIIAELMETLQVINPRLHAGVIKKLKA